MKAVFAVAPNWHRIPDTGSTSGSFTSRLSMVQIDRLANTVPNGHSIVSTLVARP